MDKVEFILQKNEQTAIMYNSFCGFFKRSVLEPEQH